ncbi:MAG TPA: aminoglycoside phosphotransferase, partial [Gammaproteobacteria bacterium]|nr:aminoglycoside phosphotransferase [Gammaproteobacteria bacterium]
MCSSSKQPPLISAMMNPDVYNHPVDNLQLIETHISWVILTGQYAYKLKKPVNLGFLDFTTLEKRRFYCEEELRLNRRLAPNIYLDLVFISGSPEKPRLNEKAEAFEFAVKMKQFPQAAQLDRMLSRGLIQSEHIDAMACFIADFHHNASV